MEVLNYVFSFITDDTYRFVMLIIALGIMIHLGTIASVIVEVRQELRWQNRNDRGILNDAPKR